MSMECITIGIAIPCNHLVFINYSTSQPVSQLHWRLGSWLVSLSFGQSVSLSVSRSADNYILTQSFSQLVGGSVSHPLCQSLNQLVNTL